MPIEPDAFGLLLPLLRVSAYVVVPAPRITTIAAAAIHRDRLLRRRSCASDDERGGGSPKTAPADFIASWACGAAAVEGPRLPASVASTRLSSSAILTTKSWRFANFSNSVR